MSDHPVHPALVHFPITFLTTAYGLDALIHGWSYLPDMITSYLPGQTELSRISYYALSLGVLTAIPTVTSGISQGLPLLSKGIKSPDGTIKPKVKTLLAHAAISDVIVVASAWLWWNKRQAGAAQLLLEGKNPASYESTTYMMIAGLITLAGTLFTASLGGSLTYDYGMGFVPASQAAKKKA
ncbi:hypothetical protein AAFC00_006640 [Neodothiora populina]|uniref:DUF2231 domain-containing protein n=1 Tax=Neodothiora populina TaxID=2781224 RepID=A0ABR3PAP5_9PEZI